MEQDANSLAETAFHEIDGLMVLAGMTDEQIDYLTGAQLYFLLQPIRDNLAEIRRLTRGPDPSPRPGGDVVPFQRRPILLES